MEIILYSTHCPRCKVLETKLQKKNISYIEETDVQKMLSLGVKAAPALGIDDKILSFKEAVDWVKDYSNDEPVLDCGSCEVSA